MLLGAGGAWCPPDIGELAVPGWLQTTGSTPQLRVQAQLCHCWRCSFIVTPISHPSCPVLLLPHWPVARTTDPGRLAPPVAPGSRFWCDAPVTLAQMGRTGAGLRWVETLPVMSPGRVGAEAPIFFKSGSSVLLCCLFFSPFGVFHRRLLLLNRHCCWGAVAVSFNPSARLSFSDGDNF